MPTKALPSYLGSLDDPLRALLLWFVALENDPPGELCRLMGVQDLDRALVEQAYQPVIVRLRELRLVSLKCDSFGFGRLLLTRLSEIALSASSEQQLTQLSRAAARLPLWIRDPELDRLERELRREECALRMEELRARRAELALLPAPAAELASPLAEQSLAASQQADAPAAPEEADALAMLKNAADQAILGDQVKSAGPAAAQKAPKRSKLAAQKAQQEQERRRQASQPARYRSA